MKTASTQQASAKPHTIKLQFSTSPEDQALFAALTASSEEALRDLRNQAIHLMRMVFGQRPIDLLDAGLDEWPGNTARRKEGYGRVLHLVPSRQRTHLLSVALYDIRTDDDGEGCFGGSCDGPYATRKAAELDLVEVKQQHPAAVAVQLTYFLDPTNSHDQAMYTRLRRVQERRAKTERREAQKGGDR